ncbi:MAG TPA: 30S ribosomal protein S1 [Flavobacteriales bacterium]|nr:30S ribosomal protein S1 [Flavobacteriales bacterium]
MSEENQKQEVSQEEVKAQPEAQEMPQQPEVQEQDPQQFLEEFNWDAYEQGIEPIKDEKLEEFEKLVDEKLKVLEENEVIEGTVIDITDRDVIIDINSKSEGVISRNEFRYNPDLKVGDKVEVMVVRKEDKNGQLQLSHKRARQLKAWDRVNEALANDEIVKGFVKARTKGGMIVDVFGIEAFLPGSQIDVKPIRDYDQYVGKTMEFKIVKINPEFKNVVVSHKALIEADLEEQKREIISQLEKGQVIEGVVKNITSYGVFVDLGGIDGLIHITDLAWKRINHPSEVVNLDDTLKVVILDFDEKKSRIQLGLKQLEPHPWDNLDENLKVGDKVKGKVSVIADYGAFVEVEPGVEGLIHVSEMSWSTHLRSAQDFVKEGEEVEAVVLSLDRDERKMSLGMKQLTPDPWADIETKYPVGSKHKGVVRNFTNFGAFVELEEGVDGLIYISDLTWNKRVKHPSDVLNIGDEVEVIVLDVDKEGRKLSLGLKQLQENVWDTYADKYGVGTEHEGEVKEAAGKGATILLDGEVEAFAPGRLMMKEDGTKLKKGEKAKFKVIEFDKDAQKIVVSHTATYKEEEERIVKQNKAKMESQEKSTLGDLDALAQLKKDMEGGK